MMELEDLPLRALVAARWAALALLLRFLRVREGMTMMDLSFTTDDWKLWDIICGTSLAAFALNFVRGYPGSSFSIYGFCELLKLCMCISSRRVRLRYARPRRRCRPRPGPQ